MTDRSNDLNSFSGAYVLNALDADEAREFEAALETSDETRYEVTELRDTAVLLGLSVAPVEPRPELKTNLMNLIASTPQLPVEEEHEVATVAPVREFEIPSKAARKAEARWFTRPVVVLSSMAAAAALIVGTVVVSGNLNDTSFQQAQAAQLAQISSADDSDKIITDVKGGGTATVIWSPELDSAAVTVDGVDTLPSDKTYELWYIDSDGARPAGTFNADDTGSGWRVLDGTMNDGDQIGVSIEPAGGSKTPTTVVAAVSTTA